MFWKKPEAPKAPEPELDLIGSIVQGMAKTGYIPYPQILLQMSFCLKELQAQQPITTPLIADRLIQTMNVFIDHLPACFILNNEYDRYEAWKGPTVPLHDLMPNCADAVFYLAGVFFQRDLLELGAFYQLRKQLRDNEEVMGVAADKCDLPPEELAHAYLHHTPLYRLFFVDVPFIIPQKTFASHGIILAPPNHGKTQLLGSLISQFLGDNTNRVGCFVLDPHGDLYQTLIHRVEPSRLVSLDPDTNPPPLNFLDFGSSTEAQTLQTFSYLMSSLSGGLSDKQGAIVPYLLKLLRKIPNASLETLRLIVDEKAKNPNASKFAVFINSLDSVSHGFFVNQFYNARMQETKDAIGWKLYSALSSDAFREMFSAKTNSINVYQLIAERKVVVVKGGRQALGDDGMRIFLQFIVAMYYRAGLRIIDTIPEDKRQLCVMFIDEAHTVLNSPLIAEVCFQLRKARCALVTATQVFDQIGQEVRSAILGATAIKMVGPVQHSDANVLSREMYTSPDFIRSMESVEGRHAYWAVHVVPNKKAYKVRVPYGSLEQLPIQMTDEEISQGFAKAIKEEVEELEGKQKAAHKEPPHAPAKKPVPDTTTVAQHEGLDPINEYYWKRHQEHHAQKTHEGPTVSAEPPKPHPRSGPAEADTPKPTTSTDKKVTSRKKWF